MRTLSCREARHIQIIEYLAKCGYQPQYIRGNNHWYISPLREEKTASFKVNTQLNVWMDFGEGIGGNLIDLGIHMHHCSVKEFLALLNYSYPGFSFHQQSPRKAAPQPRNPLIINGVKSISHSALTIYLKYRGIDPAIGDQYCKEVDFTIGSKSYFAIGFANRSGGYELRNSWFKGASSPKDITIISGGHNSTIVLEGFTDFLSLLQLSQGHAQTDFIILNSVALVERAVPILKNYQGIFLMLNHDKAGEAAMKKLQAADISFTDSSDFYQGFNDINEYLVAQRPASLQPQNLRNAPEERSRGI